MTKIKATIFILFVWATLMTIAVYKTYLGLKNFESTVSIKPLDLNEILNGNR